MSQQQPMRPLPHPVAILRNLIEGFKRNDNREAYRVAAELNYVMGYMMAQEKYMSKIFSAAQAIGLLNGDIQAAQTAANNYQQQLQAAQQQLQQAQANGGDVTALNQQIASLQAQIQQMQQDDAANNTAISQVFEAHGLNPDGSTPAPSNTASTPIAGSSTVGTAPAASASTPTLNTSEDTTGSPSTATGATPASGAATTGG